MLLKEEENRKPDANPEKVTLLINRAEHFIQTEPKKACHFAMEAIQQAQQLQLIAEKRRALRIAGLAFGKENQWDWAVEQFQQALELPGTELSDSACLHNHLGRSYASLYVHDKALEHYLTALEMHQKTDQSRQIIDDLRHIGDIYDALDDHEKALEYYQRAFEATLDGGFAESLTTNLDALDHALEMLELHDRAVEAIQLALDWCRDNDQPSGSAHCLYKLGSIAEQTGQPKRAMELYHSAITIYTKLKDLEQIARLWEAMGALYEKAKQYENAVNCYQKCLKCREELPDQQARVEILRRIGMVMIDLKLFDRATQYLDDALQLATVIDNKVQQRDIYLAYTNFYNQTGNTGIAFTFHKKYTQLSEEIASETSSRRLQEMQSRYELEKKEREAEIFRLRNVELTNKNQLITEQNGRLETLNDELRETNATKDKFFSIIAHDLKNPFNAIELTSELLHQNFDLLDEEKRKKFISNIYENSVRISALLADLLTWARSQQGRIPFNPEMLDVNAIVQTTVFLQKGPAEKKQINLVNQIPENTNAFADSNMVTTVIRNLVSNAIKFTPDGGVITISAVDLGNDLTEVSVRDTGVGIKEEDKAKLFKLENQHTTLGTNQEKGTGLGLIMCREFVEKNGGTIDVDSVEGQGSRFHFTLHKNEFTGGEKAGA